MGCSEPWMSATNTWGGTAPYDKLQPVRLPPAGPATHPHAVAAEIVQARAGLRMSPTSMLVASSPRVAKQKHRCCRKYWRSGVAVPEISRVPGSRHSHHREKTCRATRPKQEKPTEETANVKNNETRDRACASSTPAVQAQAKLRCRHSQIGTVSSQEAKMTIGCAPGVAGPRWCTTTLLQIEKCEKDPEVDVSTRQIENFFDNWKKNQHLRKNVSSWRCVLPPRLA